MCVCVWPFRDDLFIFDTSTYYFYEEKGPAYFFEKEKISYRLMTEQKETQKKRPKIDLETAKRKRDLKNRANHKPYTLNPKP